MAHRALVVDEYEHHRCASIHATVPTRAARDPTHGPTRAIPDPPAHRRRGNLYNSRWALQLVCSDVIVTLPQASSYAAAAQAATGVLATVMSSATPTIEFMPTFTSRGSFCQAESTQLAVLVDRALVASAGARREHSK